MNFSYNLIDEPWISVLDLNGIVQLRSIREALTQSQQHRQLAASLPQTNAALFRVLLAILFRVFGPIDTTLWKKIWQQQSFDEAKLSAYLQNWHQRFDLFDSEHPFFQRQNPDVEIEPANILLFNTGGGNPETLFDHSIDNVPMHLTPAQAALALVTVQSFSLAGLRHPQLKLVYTDAPCSRAAVILIQGKNLFESLMLNLVEYNRMTPMPWRGQDLPAWEMDDPFEDRRLPNGYVDYLTWQNRRVMLFPEQTGNQVMITRVSTAPGLVLSAERRNPMHHYRIDEDASAKQSPYKVLRFTEGRALWRDSAALFPSLKEKSERPVSIIWAEKLIAYRILPKRKLTLSAYGMSTDPGKSKVFFYRGDQFDFSDELLDHPELVNFLNQALERAEQVRRLLWAALNSMAGLLLAPNSDQNNTHKADQTKQLLAHWNAEGRYWQALELPFYQFLDDLPEQPELAYERWIQTLRTTARKAFDETAEAAGTNATTLKAAAIAKITLLSGLRKELDASSQEERQNA